MPPESLHPLESEADSRPDWHRLPAWIKYPAALLGVLIILGIALYFGRGSYYQVAPLGTTTPVDSSGMEYEGSAQQYADFIQQLKTVKANEYCDQVGSTTPYRNDVYTTDSGLHTAVCAILMREGATTLKNVALEGTSRYGGLEGAGTIELNGKVVLVHLYTEGTAADSTLELEKTGTLIDTKEVSAISFVEINGVGRLMKLMGTDSKGNAFERYLLLDNYRYNTAFSMPVTKSADGSYMEHVQLGMSDAFAALSFSIPLTVNTLQIGSNGRSYQVEQAEKVSPVYYAAGCGYEESYADQSFSQTLADTQNAYYANMAVISVHSASEKVIRVTTAQAGYDPQDWGKILKTLSLADFQKTVIASKAQNSSAPAKFVTIGGYSVKHIGPIAVDRTCNSYLPSEATPPIYDQYQTLKDGSVITFTFTRPVADENSAIAYMQQILSTLQITLPSGT